MARPDDASPVPDAAIVVDHWHIVRLANQGSTRSVEIPNADHRSRGRKGDALNDVHKLVLVARDRLTAPGSASRRRGRP